MVKSNKRNITRSKVNKGKKGQQLQARKISVSTPYETCSEPLSAFGGVLALIKFLDLVRFEKVFEHCYTRNLQGVRNWVTTGWGWDMRFVAIRIPKRIDKKGEVVQCELFEDDRYTHRMFCVTRFAKPHKVIEGYDKRADVENLVGEAKREGLEAIPSKKFKNNYAWFQLVMLTYNIWRY